jgi:hypothetical protein
VQTRDDVVVTTGAAAVNIVFASRTGVASGGLVDGERRETLVQLARDVAVEGGADLADIGQGLALASCQMQAATALSSDTTPTMVKVSCCTHLIFSHVWLRPER